jgi:SAM-dependent methyltransferase
MEAYTLEYYQAINREESPQAQALAQAITRIYHPRSVIDLGCGTGLYLEPFDCAKRGIDISLEAFQPEVCQAIDCLCYGDLSQPIEYLQKYSLALCLEVVEHIGSENADTLVDNICRASDTIVMTAAPPGQAGLNHVNCQPQAYWEAKFAAHGFRRDYHDEYQLVSRVAQVPHTVWIIRNLMVFKAHAR